jgi:hypothetical protein
MAAAFMSNQMGVAYAKDVTLSGIVDLGNSRPC